MDIYNKVTLPEYHNTTRWERVCLYLIGAQIVNNYEFLGVGWDSQEELELGLEASDIFGNEGGVGGWTIQDGIIGGTSGLRLLRYARQAHDFHYTITPKYWLNKKREKIRTPLYSLNLDITCKLNPELYSKALALNKRPTNPRQLSIIE